MSAFAIVPLIIGAILLLAVVAAEIGDLVDFIRDLLDDISEWRIERQWWRRSP